MFLSSTCGMMKTYQRTSGIGKKEQEDKTMATNKMTVTTKKSLARAACALALLLSLGGGMASAAPAPVSIDGAREYAVSEAGVPASAVTYIRSESDMEGGAKVYEIRFHTDTHGYKYEIDAATGAIREKSVRLLNRGRHDTNGNPSNRIDQERAREIAARQFGFSASDVTFYKLELDTEQGNAEYECGFYKDAVRYRVDVDAVTGDVVKYAYDHDGYHRNRHDGPHAGHHPRRSR
jgi:hypothetical protein